MVIVGPELREGLLADGIASLLRKIEVQPCLQRGFTHVKLEAQHLREAHGTIAREGFRVLPSQD